MFLSISTPASANVDISGLHIGFACRDKLAPVLCAIKEQHRRTEVWRVQVGNSVTALSRNVYEHPHRRPFYLWQWRHRRIEARAYYRSLWAWFATSGASCIHRYESKSWTEPGSPGGGMQFVLSTWLNYVVRGYQFAPAPAQASPTEQVRAAKRLVDYDGGWREWSTHSLCGL